MNRAAALLLLSSLVSGCGSSPTSPTAAAPTASRTGLSLSLQVSPDPLPEKGWRSPTSVTLRSFGPDAPASIEKTTLQMFDEAGVLLAESTLSTDVPTAPEALLMGNVAVHNLSWPAEKGYGKRMELALTVRLASGELSSTTLSVPVR